MSNFCSFCFSFIFQNGHPVSQPTPTKNNNFRKTENSGTETFRGHRGSAQLHRAGQGHPEAAHRRNLPALLPGGRLGLRRPNLRRPGSGFGSRPSAQPRDGHEPDLDTEAVPQSRDCHPDR